jgi:hypothetical protein
MLSCNFTVVSDKGIVVHGLHLLVGSPLHTKPESQHADFAWKDGACDISLPDITAE